MKNSTIHDICRQLVTVFDRTVLYERAVTLIQQAVQAKRVRLFTKTVTDGAGDIPPRKSSPLPHILDETEHFIAGFYLELQAIAADGDVGYNCEIVYEQDATANRERIHIDTETISQSGQVVVEGGESRLLLPVRLDKVDYAVLEIEFSGSNILDSQTIEGLVTVTSFLAVAINNVDRCQQLEQEAQGKINDDVLHLTEERFRQVVASISAHVYVTEVTEGDRLVNHYISPNVEILTGYPREKISADWSFWPRKIICLEDQPLADYQFNELRKGRNSTIEYRLLRADGQIIWVRDSGRVEEHGTSLMIYGVVSDITDRKEAEEALRQERSLLARRVAERTSELSAANSKLARASRLKDEFLANMSHELRTPLNAILGMAEVLRSGVYGDLNQEQCNAARHIEESGSHLLSLITDILDLSKIEAEKLELEIGPTSPDYVCEASLRMITQVARKKRIKVLSRYDERVKLIQVDQRRLKQILVNLLSNAVKFTPSGGQIGLYVQGDQTEEQVRFIVWDTGIGITSEDVKRLFKPFVQLDSKLSRNHEGSGLGLSLVARLAEMHGGSVSVESDVGQGSRFTVSLPWRPSDQHLGTSPDDEVQTVIALRDHVLDPLKRDPPLVLLAEDNEANVVTLTEFLQGLEYRVIVARNGFEAVERASNEHPDVVIMDVQMPGMDGLEATRQLRASGATKHLPVIALTALAMPGDRERCIAAGVNEYLSKPVGLRKLMEVIESQLGQISMAV
jgi:PAS domain S-box-containing protein